MKTSPLSTKILVALSVLAFQAPAILPASAQVATPAQKLEFDRAVMKKIAEHENTKAEIEALRAEIKRFERGLKDAESIRNAGAVGTAFTIGPFGIVPIIATGVGISYVAKRVAPNLAPKLIDKFDSVLDKIDPFGYLYGSTLLTISMTATGYTVYTLLTPSVEEAKKQLAIVHARVDRRLAQLEADIEYLKKMK